MRKTAKSHGKSCGYREGWKLEPIVQSVTMGKFTASGQLNSPLYFLSSLVCSLSLMATSLCFFLCVLGHIFFCGFQAPNEAGSKKKEGWHLFLQFSSNKSQRRPLFYFILLFYYFIFFGEGMVVLARIEVKCLFGGLILCQRTGAL